jgi:hypothetical protein
VYTSFSVACSVSEPEGVKGLFKTYSARFRKEKWGKIYWRDICILRFFSRRAIAVPAVNTAIRIIGPEYSGMMLSLKPEQNMLSKAQECEKNETRGNFISARL